MTKINPYRIVIDWSDEDQTYIARVPELDGVVTHGDTQVKALEMAHEAIDLHLESLKAHNEPAPKPVSLKDISGKLPLRMGQDRHRNAVIQAHKRGAKSLNEYICSLIDEKESTPHREKNSQYSLLKSAAGSFSNQKSKPSKAPTKKLARAK